MEVKMKRLKKVLACALMVTLTFSAAAPKLEAASKFEAGSPTTSIEPEDKNNVTVPSGKVNTKKDGSVTLAGVKKTSKKFVKIPSSVTVYGVRYKITIVKANAFANARRATNIKLPATIKQINKNAFRGVTKLRILTLKGKKAIRIKKGAFNGINSRRVTVKVSRKMPKKQVKLLRKRLKKAGFRGKVKYILPVWYRLGV